MNERLTETVVTVLRCFTDQEPGMGYSFKPLQEITNLGRVAVRDACRELAQLGFLKFANGCSTEDGEFAGSCYVLTDLGFPFVRDLFQYESDMPRTVWTHEKSTQQYAVVHLANTESGKPQYVPTVVYQNIMNGAIYTRPLNDWYRSMTYSHRLEDEAHYALTDSDWSFDDKEEGRATVIRANSPEEAIRIATGREMVTQGDGVGIHWKVARLMLVGFQGVEWDNGKATYDYFEPYDLVV